MERWQIFYLFLLAFGFIVGWRTYPILGAAVVWAGIIVSEIIIYRTEIMELNLEIEEDSSSDGVDHSGDDVS